MCLSLYQVPGTWKVKKVLVLAVNGLLMFEPPQFCEDHAYYGTFYYRDVKYSFSNIVIRPSLDNFLKLCLRHCYVGIWLTMRPHRLGKVLEYLLSVEVSEQLLFVWGRDRCSDKKNFSYVYKNIAHLHEDVALSRFCTPGQGLVVDPFSERHRRNPPSTGYHPQPWEGRL